MIAVTTNYRVTDITLVIMPAAHPTYPTKIIETTNELYSTQTPLAIVKENCLRHGSTFEGRRAAVRYHLSFSQKTPIPIHPAASIIASPTKPARDPDCIWLFWRHLHLIERISKQETKIYFDHHSPLTIKESIHSLKMQKERAGMCATLFQQWN
ncbi:competence protein ComK [Gracilibacillus caseinilyticus]|uniref:Competence protein ComK n=1 Tax=Gracilibacillus caseinilyticus TaxID=2932256 RepID=A0ABY4F0Y0_9BACI|nr:competence protein ComK [Gracilibacillus caseinilyticus]UOQ50333.1 competence protein ComK [Gracilibacillus caseinilyticus]